MEDAIDGDAPLDYASIWIFPSQNRYEAFVCKEKQSENVAAGHLEHLLPHFPGINDLYAKGFDANFDFELPENLRGAEWFSKATVKRFHNVVNSPDLLNIMNMIMHEMCRMEESKKFHLSLYGKDHEGPLESEQRDGYSSYGIAPTSEPEFSIASSGDSKDELLRAMNLRLLALSNKLPETFIKATGANFSPRDIIHLVKFSRHFGATDIENSLCKFIELNQNNQDAGPTNNETAFLTCNVKNDDASRAAKNPQICNPVHSDASINHGVSPAKAAQVETQSSAESEESSNSSDEGRTSDRSHLLVRSASPIRSASPVRKIQIGRSRPHRAAALTTKSLDVFPDIDKPISYRYTAENGFYGEISGKHCKKPEIDVERITVQDAINLFESKQWHQTADIQNRKSLKNVSIGINKSALQRWSTAMGHASVQEDQPEFVPVDLVTVTSSGMALVEIQNDSELEVVSDFISESHNNNAMTDCEVKPETQENIGSYTVDNQAETEPKVGEEIVKRLIVSAERNKQKQTEPNQMIKKLTESKPVKLGKFHPNKNQIVSFVQQGGPREQYKEKRDFKLWRENSEKQLEREQFQEMKKSLDKVKPEMASKNVCASKKNSTRNPLKSIRNSVQPANFPRQTPKPPVTKKISPKTSSIPATCKYWSPTPLPRSSGTSLAKVRGGISSACSSLTNQKPQPAASVPHPSTQRENSQKQGRDEKETQSDNVRSLKSLAKKHQPAVPNKTKAIKAKVMTASGESPVPSKLILCNKGTKESSVVLLESKPFLRKGSGIGCHAGKLSKKKNPPPMEKCLGDHEDHTEDKECGFFLDASDLVSQHSDRDTMTRSLQSAATEPESNINNHLQCGDTGNLDQAPIEGGIVLTNIGESALIMKTDEELIISPSAWEEIEEELELPKPCEDSTFQSASVVTIPPPVLASPCVNHSLFWLLQEEISKLDTSDWRNADEEPTISPSAWEIEEELELPKPCQDGTYQSSSLATISPVGLDSACVRHSLFQMLREEISKPGTNEWGNAEILPDMIYQKVAPKGLKKFLRFAQKSKR